MKFIYLFISALTGSAITILIFLSPIRMNMKRAKELKEDRVVLCNKKTLNKLALASDSLSLDRAGEMTDSFRTETIFNIPLAWTFEREDIDRIFYNDNIDRLKLYAAIRGYDGASVMTLVAVGYNKTLGTDIVINEQSQTNIFEYADPCPPKCKGANHRLWPSCLLPPYTCNCFYRQVISLDTIGVADCNFEPDVITPMNIDPKK